MIESKEFFYKFRESEEKILDKHNDLITYIKRVPHLDLGIDINLDLLKKESSHINQTHPHRLHRSKHLRSDYFDFHEFSFQGVCLMDYISDDVKGMSDSQSFIYEEPEAQFDGYKVKFFQTPSGSKMPYLMNLLNTMSPNVNRTRYIVTPPTGGIPWHSHHNNIYDVRYLRLCILNIPIITNPDCAHGVRDYRDKSAEEHWDYYKPGRAYMFNSWHDHCFWNKGDEERQTIIPYFNFSDENLLEFLARRLDSYTGPLIDE